MAYDFFALIMAIYFSFLNSSVLILDKIETANNSLFSSEFDTLLDNTQGIWKEGDGLEYQQKMREEWS